MTDSLCHTVASTTRLFFFPFKFYFVFGMRLQGLGAEAKIWEDEEDKDA